MIEVKILPDDRLEAVQSEACAEWLLANTTGVVIGHTDGPRLHLRFTDSAEAEAFSARLLGAG